MILQSPDILVFVTCPKETNPMNIKKALLLVICLFLAVSCLAQMGGKPRGKAELKAGDGSLTIDYGRPDLKGRDMLSQLPAGQSWRMGSNTATVLSTPVDLTFGSTKIAKGSYSLFLKRKDAEVYELVFNSQTGQWGLQHDAAKDVAQAPMKKEVVPNSVETFTIDLKPAANGGALVLTWGTTQLSAEFQFAK
jgi:hypothetical protein